MALNRADCILPLLYTFSYLGTIALFLLWIPSFIYKCFVVALAKIFYPDLRHIFNPKSIILSDDAYHDNPSNCSIVSVTIFDGYISLEQVISLFEENVFNARIQDNRNILRYPELQEYPVSFLGYPFYKKELIFNPREHISENRINTNLSATEIHQILLNTPFQKDRSLWQLFIFRNEHRENFTKPETTSLALRIHHSMCDGRSLVKLLVECLGNKSLTATEAKFLERNKLQKLAYCALLPYQLLNLSLKLMKLQLKFYKHPWHHHTYPQNRSSLFVSVSPPIDLIMMKKIASTSGVQTSSVIICAIITAIQKYFEDKKDWYNLFPGTFPVYLMIPKKGHPPTFSNHLYIGISQVQMDPEMNHKQRLKMCDKIYKNMRQGDHTLHTDFMTNLLATFPEFLRSQLSSMRGVPTGVSNIAGEQNGFSVGGYPCQDVSMSAGLPQGSIGVSFTILSYKNHFRLSVVANASVLSKDDTILMGGLVENQLLNFSMSN